MLEGDKYLNVFWGEQLTGRLTLKSDRLEFSYSENWLNSNNPPISLSLPKDDPILCFQNATAFFINLTYEGLQFQQLSERNNWINLPEYKTIFNHLARYGQDCGGALSIFPPYFPVKFLGGNYIKITQQFNNFLQNTNRLLSLPAALENMGFTVNTSLAGFQDKIPIYRDPSFTDFYLPELNSLSPTNWILKAKSERFADILFNEFLCLNLARTIGLETVNCEFIEIGDNPYLLIERYDRYRNSWGFLGRLHQEDLCQAKTLHPSQKYEHTLGLPYHEFYKLFQSPLFRNGLKCADAFISRILFDYIIGNVDGHAKNFSLLYGLDGFVALSPVYDLIAYEIMPFSFSSSLSIGGEFHYSKVKSKNWLKFSNDMGITSSYLSKKMLLMMENIKNALPVCFKTKGKPFKYQELTKKIRKFISERCQKLRVAARELNVLN